MQAVPRANRTTAGTERSLARLRRLVVKHQKMLFTVASTLAIFGLMAIHSILLARLLGPQGRGEYGTAIFYAQTMIYIGLFGSHYAIARIASENRAKRSELQRSAFRVGVVVGFTSLAITCLLIAVGLPMEKQQLMPLCFICALFLPAEHLRLTAQAVDHGFGSFTRYNLSRIFPAAIFPMLVAAFYLFEIRSLTMVCWTTVGVALVGYGFYFCISDTKNILGPTKLSTARVLREGLPDGGLVLANDLFDRLAILLVIWICSFEDQGFYLTAIPIATLLLVAPNALELFSFRVGADPNATPKTQDFFRALGLMLLLQASVMIALQFTLAPLVEILFGDAFEPAIPVARVLILAFGFAGFSIVGEGYLRGKRMARLAIQVRFLSAFVMVSAAFLLPASTAIVRVASATAVGHLFHAFAVLLLTYRTISKSQLQHGEQAGGGS